MESEEDAQRALAEIDVQADAAHRRCQQLLGLRKPLGRLLARHAPDSRSSSLIGDPFSVVAAEVKEDVPVETRPTLISFGTGAGRDTTACSRVALLLRLVGIHDGGGWRDNDNSARRGAAPSVVTTRFWSCDVPGRLCWIASSSRRRPPPSRVSEARRSRWPFAVPARAISAANDPIGHEDAIDGAGAGAGAKSSRLARRMRCPGGPLAAASTS